MLLNYTEWQSVHKIGGKDGKDHIEREGNPKGQEDGPESNLV